jgi:ABC-type transport system involved in multi-copper enzyme maturation permease subunit
MRNVFTIARATFREALRAKVFLYLLVVAIAMVLASVPTAELGVGEQLRLIIDVSMAGAGFVAAFLAVFLGVSSVSGEVEKRTVYTIIAKAVSRTQFVLGKYLGVLATVSVAVSISYVAIIALVSTLSERFPVELFAAWLLVSCEMALLVSVAIFFSCVTRPLLSSGFTVGLYLVGLSLYSLHYWVERAKSGIVSGAMRSLYWLLPYFAVFVVKTEIVHHLAIEPGRVAFAVTFSLAYSAAVLLLATFVFERRDLK